MKSLKRTLTFICLLLSFSSFAGITEDISAALKEGNAFTLASFFQDKIDLTLLDETDLMSKLEAEQLMYKFFRENPPSDFIIRHQVTSKSGLEYTIGRLTTANGIFRVSFYINKTGDSEFIQQIIIDTE